MRLIVLTIVSLTMPVAAWAGGTKPVTDAATLKECGACHMAFQPVFLPADSWRKLMAPEQLSRHFGDDASLPEPVRKQIEDYLAANASQGWMARTEALRITETPYWLKEHRSTKVKPQAFLSPKVKSKANCQACHKEAQQGLYEDD
jgi:hypothetical protein